MYKPQLATKTQGLAKMHIMCKNEKMAKSQENGYGTNLASKVVLECHNIHKRNTS